MSRITSMAKAIAERYDIDAKEAESFISTMVEVLNEALQYEKLVKIKGLGTFKVTTVSARESIDVTTGERITIDSRDKITFTPEASMRDRVNSPFAQFETVVLSDGVDFSQIDEKYLEDETEEKTEENSMDVLGKETSQAKAEPLFSTASEPVSVEKEKHIEKEQAESIAGWEMTALVNADRQEGKSEAELLENASEPDVPVGVSGAEKTESHPEYEMEEQLTKKISNMEHEEILYLREELKDAKAEKADLEIRLNRCVSLLKWLIAALVILLITGVGSAVYLGSQMKCRDNRIEHLVAQIVTAEKKSQGNVAEEELLDQEDSDEIAQEAGEPEEKVSGELKEQQPTEEGKEKNEAEKTAPSSQSTSAASTTPVAKQSAPTTASKPKATPESTTKKAVSDGEYDSDPRVRLGAYRIVGIDKTVTVLKGQTLSMISKAHLGAGMECYVEAVNKGVTSVKEGDKVNIPKLELKKRNTTK